MNGAQDILYWDQLARVLAVGATLADKSDIREMFLRWRTHNICSASLTRRYLWPLPC